MPLLLILFSVPLAILPSLAYLGVVWWLDRYEREPLWLVGLVFGWGAVGGVLLGVIGSVLLRIPVAALAGASAAEIGSVVAIAPFVEELAKGAILPLLLLGRNFDNASDGFVYGAASGLGFAMVENLLYSFGAAGESTGAWLVTVVLRTLCTAPMHALATACLGSALGWAKFRRNALVWIVMPPLGLLAAMSVHGLWNTLAVISDHLHSLALLGFSALVLLVEFALLFALFQVSLLGESRIIARRLAEEARVGVIPAAHAAVLPYYFRRLGSRWLARGVPKRRYVTVATLLAFRLEQFERSAEPQRRTLVADIQKLRTEIGRLLAGRR